MAGGHADSGDGSVDLLTVQHEEADTQSETWDSDTEELASKGSASLLSSIEVAGAEVQTDNRTTDKLKKLLVLQGKEYG